MYFRACWVDSVKYASYLARLTILHEEKKIQCFRLLCAAPQPSDMILHPQTEYQAVIYTVRYLKGIRLFSQTLQILAISAGVGLNVSGCNLKLHPSVIIAFPPNG